MESRNQKSSQSFSYLLFTSVMMLVLITLSGSAFIARARSTKEAVAPPINATVRNAVLTTTPQTTERTRPIADFESELITITPHGFEPQEITRPQGRFMLMVDNRSGLATTSLSLTSEAGSRTHEIGIPREAPNWSEIVDLPPGRYVLRESEHPRWACRIRITAL